MVRSVDLLDQSLVGPFPSQVSSDRSKGCDERGGERNTRQVSAAMLMGMVLYLVMEIVDRLVGRVFHVLGRSL
jgi:hypothetical protein